MHRLSNDIHWVAGILEGEATFGNLKNIYPRIILNMCDLDIVQRVRNIMDSSAKIYPRDNGTNHRVSYTLRISKQSAIGWMMTIYPLMGNRRQERIRELLQIWKNHTSVDYASRQEKRLDTKRNNKMIQIVMLARKISRVEAEKVVEECLTSSNQTMMEKKNAPTIQ